MPRLLFTVAPSSPGWQLYEGTEPRQWFARRAEALAAAELMASVLNAHHGIATAVLLDKLGCAPVVLASHG